MRQGTHYACANLPGTNVAEGMSENRLYLERNSIVGFGFLGPILRSELGCPLLCTKGADPSCNITATALQSVSRSQLAQRVWCSAGCLVGPSPSHRQQQDVLLPKNFDSNPLCSPWDHRPPSDPKSIATGSVVIARVATNGFLLVNTSAAPVLHFA